MGLMQPELSKIGPSLVLSKSSSRLQAAWNTSLVPRPWKIDKRMRDDRRKHAIKRECAYACIEGSGNQSNYYVVHS